MSESVSARVPEETTQRVERLVENGEFDTRSEAVAELLADRVDELGVELPSEDEDEEEDEAEDDGEGITKTITVGAPTDTEPQFSMRGMVRSGLGDIASITLPEVPVAAAVGAWLVYGNGAQMVGVPTVIAPIFAVLLVLGALIA